MIIPNFCLLTAFLYRNHHDKRCATSSKILILKFQYTFKFLNDTFQNQEMLQKKTFLMFVFGGAYLDYLLCEVYIKVHPDKI